MQCKQAEEGSVSDPLAVSVPEAARLLGISPRHAWNLVQAGELPVVRLGHRVVISREHIEEVLKGKADDAT
jgi:excisionase family DNA binding protein